MKDESRMAAVIGLGYVGLPLAMLMVKKNIPVMGFDTDARKVRKLLSGRSYIPDISHREVEEAVQSGMFMPQTPSERVAEAGLAVVSVPTPLGKNGKPDLSALKAAASFVAKHLRKGQTIVFESSTFPGTLEEVILPILAESGLQAGKDYYLGYSPERIDPGNHQFPAETIPKVVSGLTEACLEKVNEWYSRLFQKTVPVSAPKVAETCKLVENIQRLVNISLVNELDLICERMGVDVWETLEAAATKPFGFTPYWPGPGAGGHCIPVDPQYFQWKARKCGQTSRLIEAASRINEAMPRRIAERVMKLVGKKGGKVLIIGLAYKKDVNDIRESPALDICALLSAAGCEIEYHDPHVPDCTIAGKKYVSKSLTPALIREADAVVVLTDHTAVDWELVRAHARRILDTRGVLRRIVRGQAG